MIRIIADIEPGAFFQALSRIDSGRDYSIIVDASGSMWNAGSAHGKTRWQEARSAVAKLVPHACRCDPDGITLYFFGSRFIKYENVTSAEMVMALFDRTNSLGSTNLAAVLADAVMPDNAGRPETVLVITDGAPDSEKQVESLIIKTVAQLKRDPDLSISFIQVGDDKAAKEWLKTLDDDLVAKGAKFDVVDTLTVDDMHGLTFEMLIELSVHD